METKRPNLGPHDIAVGIDLATTGHVVVILDARGRRLTRFKIPHSPDGLRELCRRSVVLAGDAGRPWFAFEATGHVWPAIAHALGQAGHVYRMVNPLATHRVREARQMGRDKSDLTDAEQIADLLRTGIVTETQLLPPPYVELRRAFHEYDRLRFERARLKTLLTHQIYGWFPEFVGNWAHIDAPGALAVLRLGLTPTQIAAHTQGELVAKTVAAAKGRRLWRPKVRQLIKRAQHTVAPPHGAAALAREVVRIVARIDVIGAQMDESGVEVQAMLAGLEEAKYLATIPALRWPTIAGLLAEIGPIDRYHHGRQLCKLAGTTPGRKQTGAADPRTGMTHRGRGRLRALLFMATIAGIQHNPRLAAHFDRLVHRTDRPLTKMAAIGACMNKLLLYAFAVMKHRRPFDIDHKWREDATTAA